MKIHEEYACVGYFGFGSGVALALREGARAPGRSMYCNTCPAGAACWTKHRDRVRRLCPDLMAVLDELTATGLRGPALALAYANKIARLTGRDPKEIAPPEVYVMTGNIEDGARIAAGLPPKDRGPEQTLSYPFES